MKFSRILLVFGICSSAISVFAKDASCPTSQLKPLVGNYTGSASIVTFGNGHFSFRKVNPFAPKTLSNESRLTLDPADPCNEFHLKIDYLNPFPIALLSGNRVAREVRFDGVSTMAGENIFDLLIDGQIRGHLRVVDTTTFMATFTMPNPLNPKQMTSCKEFISLTSDSHIVRTIQCFDNQNGSFVEDRLTLEKIIRTK